MLLAYAGPKTCGDSQIRHGFHGSRFDVLLAYASSNPHVLLAYGTRIPVCYWPTLTARTDPEPDVLLAYGNLKTPEKDLKSRKSPPESREIHPAPRSPARKCYLPTPPQARRATGLRSPPPGAGRLPSRADIHVLLAYGDPDGPQKQPNPPPITVLTRETPREPGFQAAGLPANAGNVLLAYATGVAALR